MSHTNSNQTMVNYKRLLEMNWLWHKPVQQWYQSGRSKSWEKPIHNRTQKGFEKGYLLSEGVANTLPRSSRKKQLSHEFKEMLTQKLNEIEAYNAIKRRAIVKEKGEGSVNTTKEKRARCYICRKRGHVFWKCPNKKNSTTLKAPTIDNQSKEPTMVRNEEILKYPKKVYVKTDYMIEGTDFSNWDNIWYISSAYKKHMSPIKSLFKRLKNILKVEGTQHERKIIFSHGIGEAIVETSEKKIVIPCMLYTPKITLNVLSLDQLMAQGFVVTYGHNKCQISYMFEEDKEGCDGETDCATSKEVNCCDVETESMIEKNNKYLEEYFDSIDSKDALNSFKRFISFLNLIKNDSIVFKNWEVLRKRFEDMINWFYLIYLKQDVLEPLPPVIGNVKIDLLGLYKMVDSMGGYLSVSFRNRWKEVVVIHGLTEAHKEDLKACYKRTIDLVKFCYDTTLRTWFKEEPVKCEKTKKVEGGCDHAKEKNPQEHDGSKGNNDTDVDQMANQEDGANISETNDFMVIT
ncbi:ARID DNA-binding domain-containing protein [Tanacetum coccineum]